jgi:YbbR domain-containing protein
VDSIKKVVAQVDISEKSATVVGTLPLRLIDGQGKDVNEISFRPDMVEVTVPIVPVSKVNIRPDIKGDPPEGYIIRDVTVDTPTMLVTAGNDVLASLQAIDTDPVYIQGHTKTVQMDVNLKLPKGVRLFQEELKTVKVTVIIEKLTTTSLTLSSRDIEVQNLTPDTAAILEEREITLEASGPESLIDRVSGNMVKMYVDVNGLVEGEHQVRIKADIARPYVITQIEPLEIGVTVRRLDSSRRGDNI